MRRIPQSPNARREGQTSITTAAGGTPVTKVGDTSGAGTTFSVTTGVDGAAWDLSAVLAGDIAITSDNCIGEITDVDDGNDTITLAAGWSCEATGYNRDIRASANAPVAGSTITIFRVAFAKRIKIKAPISNSADVFIAKHGAATTGDFQLSPGYHVIFVPDAPHEFVELSQVYAIAASGTQVVEYMPGAED